jgi:hypothetical protein
VVVEEVEEEEEDQILEEVNKDHQEEVEVNKGHQEEVEEVEKAAADEILNLNNKGDRKESFGIKYLMNYKFHEITLFSLQTKKRQISFL